MNAPRTLFVITLAAVALWAQAPQGGDGRGKAKGGPGDAKGGRGGRGGGEAKAIVPPPDPQVLRLVRPDLYLITGEGGNSVFRVTPEGVILVDTKLPKAGNYERLTELIRGVTPQPVNIVLNTHRHPDHAGNNAHFGTAGARIVAEHAGMSRVVTVAAPRAHTGNDSIFHFPADRVIAIGDLIAPSRAPAIDYTSGGSFAGTAQALDGILMLDWNVAIPGHGDPVNRAFVETYRNRVRTLIERGRDAVARGVAKEQLIARLKTDDLGWQLQLDSAQLDGFYAEMSAR